MKWFIIAIWELFLIVDVVIFVYENHKYNTPKKWLDFMPGGGFYLRHRRNS